jgi:hypothetical protein
LTPEFLKEFKFFKKFEYEVHQVGSNEACSQNFSFLETNTFHISYVESKKLGKPNRKRKSNVDAFIKLLNSSNVIKLLLKYVMVDFHNS